MSSKTKIIVLHKKEVIYLTVLAVLGILFLLLLFKAFGPTSPETALSSQENNAESPEGIYTPGIYTNEINLGSETVNVEVIVTANAISSIQLNNLSDTVTTMYPLLQPTLSSICEQIYENQSLENITYSTNNKYTSMVLLDAIQSSLEKARKTNSIVSPE